MRAHLIAASMVVASAAAITGAQASPGLLIDYGDSGPLHLADGAKGEPHVFKGVKWKKVTAYNRAKGTATSVYAYGYRQNDHRTVKLRVRPSGSSTKVIARWKNHGSCGSSRVKVVWKYKRYSFEIVKYRNNATDCF